MKQRILNLLIALDQLLYVLVTFGHDLLMKPYPLLHGDGSGLASGRGGCCAHADRHPPSLRGEDVEAVIRQYAPVNLWVLNNTPV